MASDVTGPEPAPPSPAGIPHFPRFLAVYVLLGVALWGAVAIGVIYGLRGGGPGGPSWSAWHPTGGGLGISQQIASHVGKEYRLANGSQLVDPIAKPAEVTASGQTIKVGYVAIRGNKSTSDKVESITSTNSVLYTLCGLGPSCSIASGTPTVERGRLVQREILELALYTFRYNSAVSNVIAFMPPASTGKQPVVIYLQRSDVSSQLQVPLARTLSRRTPSVTTMTAGDATHVFELAGRHAYSFTLTQAQDGNAVLVLTHIKA